MMSEEHFEDLNDDFKDPINTLTREDILAERYTISPTHDTPFKFLFGQEGESEPLLMSLLNELLDLQGEERIVELKYINTEVTPSVLDGRRLLLDLRVTDQRGKTYNVEIQREDSASIIKRSIFQFSRISGEQLKSGAKFDDLEPVYVVLLCCYKIYPDPLVCRVFKLLPTPTNEGREREVLAHRPEHFDPQTTPRYSQYKRRLSAAAEGLDLFRVYLVELVKDARVLKRDAQGWASYLMSEHTVDKGEPRGDEAMNEKISPSHKIPDGVSEETRGYIERAQERLEFFAARPELKRAYERELLEHIEFNSLVHQREREGFEAGEAKGRAEMIAQSLPRLRAAGLEDNQIIEILGLSAEEVERLLRS